MCSGSDEDDECEKGLGEKEEEVGCRQLATGPTRGAGRPTPLRSGGGHLVS